MVTSANVWDMIDSYCTTNNKCIIKFNNSKIASASASKQAEVWTWYANFAEDSVLDMMKTPQQREYEEKMIDMFIDELNKKGKENNES
mgnify:CR=1 FL=1